MEWVLFISSGSTVFKVVFARVSKFLLILSVSRENFVYFLDLWVKSCTFLFLSSPQGVVSLLWWYLWIEVISIQLKFPQMLHLRFESYKYSSIVVTGLVSDISCLSVKKKKNFFIWNLPPSVYSFNSFEWPRQNFSLQYQYNINHISDKNKGKYQSLGIINWSST